MSAVEKISPEDRSSVFLKINQEIPRSSTGFPEFIYRADIIPADFHDLTAREQHECLSEAALPLSFHEGYPTLESGLPFWEQLPFEPAQAFDAFVTYLSLPMKDLPARRVWELRSYEAYKGIDINSLTAMATIYYWVDRARAYDLFVQINHKLSQSRRIMELESEHYSMSTKMLNKTLQALETAFDDEDRVKEVPIPRLAEMVERFARIQRMAVGLTASGSATYLEMQGPRGASLRAAYESAADTDAPKQISNADTAHQTNMRALLSDPAALEAAQELVIKMMMLPGANGNPTRAEQDAADASSRLADLEAEYTSSDSNDSDYGGN